MKTIITLFLCFFFGLVQAQDWSFFPKDSLRCYTVNEYGQLMGIDFRDHDSVDGQSILRLDSFANFIKVDTLLPGYSNGRHQFYYKHGNSDFGNRIVASQDTSLVIFKDYNVKTIDTDTILLLHTNVLGAGWVFYENDSVLIKARVYSLEEGSINGKKDSVKNIHLWGFTKSALNDSLLYNIRVGKAFGVYEIPKLDGFIRHSQKTYYGSIYHWMKYVEYDFYDFGKNDKEYEKHFYHSPYSQDEHQYLRIKYSADNEVLKVKGYIRTKTDSFLPPPRYVYFDTTYSNDLKDYWWYGVNDFGRETEVRMRHFKGRQSFVPFGFIPGRMRYLIYGAPYDLDISLRCDSSYSIDINGIRGKDSPYSYNVRRIIDNIWGGYSIDRYDNDYYYLTQYEGETSYDGNFNVSYVQGQGYAGTIGTGGYGGYPPGGYDYSIEMIYHPDEKCKEQNPIRFASINDIQQRKQLNVYPNPASSVLQIPIAQGKSLHFEIQNLSGVVVSSGHTSGTIHLDDLANGLYIVQVIEGSQISRVKINILH
jgi:hypothetical protein